MKMKSLFLLTFVMLTACAPGGEATPSLLAVPSPTRAPTSSETPAPTVDNQAVAPLCLRHQTVEHAEFAVTVLDDYVFAIEDFLNLGASQDDLEIVLFNMGAAVQPIPSFETDFDGDGFNDLAVSLKDPVLGAMVVFYLCDEMEYYAIQTVVPRAEEGRAVFWAARDFDADGLAEILYGWESCDGDTCRQRLEVLAFNGEVFVRRTAEIPESLPVRGIQLIDENGDGVFAIEAELADGGKALWDYDLDSGMWVLESESP